MFNYFYETIIVGFVTHSFTISQNLIPCKFSFYTVSEDDQGDNRFSKKALCNVMPTGVHIRQSLSLDNYWFCQRLWNNRMQLIVVGTEKYVHSCFCPFYSIVNPTIYFIFTIGSYIRKDLISTIEFKWPWNLLVDHFLCWCVEPFSLL